MESILLFPVLHAFLALRVSLFTVETKESNEGAKHTSKDTQSDQNVGIDTHMARFSSSFSAGTVLLAVPRLTLFIAIARFTEGLFVETNFLDGIAVETGGAVSSRDNVDIFPSDFVGDVSRVFDYARILKGGVGPHADVVETD